MWDFNLIYRVCDQVFVEWFNSKLNKKGALLLVYDGRLKMRVFIKDLISPPIKARLNGILLSSDNTVLQFVCLPVSATTYLWRMRLFRGVYVCHIPVWRHHIHQCTYERACLSVTHGNIIIKHSMNHNLLQTIQPTFQINKTSHK